MSVARIVTTNPNPNAMTLVFDSIPECFQPFDRLGIAANDFASASPFAKAVMDEGRKDISRMDFVRRGHGGEISFIGKLPWTSTRGTDPRPCDAFNRWSGKFLMDVTAMTNNFNELVALDSSRDLVVLTHEVLNNPEVQEKLAQDGGDILVVDVPYHQESNSFTVNIALLGSCSGCDQASLTTLQGIESRITKATQTFNQDFKQNAAEGHPYQTIQFAGLKTTELDGSFYSLNPNYTPSRKKVFGLF